MEIDLNKTLRALVCCLPEDSEPNVEALTKMYRQTLRERRKAGGRLRDPDVRRSASIHEGVFCGVG